MGHHRSVIAVMCAFALLLADGASAAAQDIPLLDDPLNCAQAQEPFDGGPQPVALDDTANVQLSTECFLVVSVTVSGGEPVGVTYLSGQFDSLNVAFYRPFAVPGASFHDPANAQLGVPTSRAPVPGTGPQDVIVAIQGVDGPALGTAAIRIDSGEAPPPTTTTTSTTTTTTSTTLPASTTAADEPAAESTSSTESTSTMATPAEDDEPAPTTTGAPSTTVESRDEGAPERESGDDASTSGSDDGLPWPEILGGTIAAFVLAGALVARRRRAARRRVAAPWERPVISWTLQHQAPTGSCTTSARALVVPEDDGSLDDYRVAELFTVPPSGKRNRSVIGDPLLAQLETLYAGRGSGAELRSAVDAFVNTLTTHLDSKKATRGAALLVELRRENAALTGDVYACTNGQWQPYDRWQEIPKIDNPAQHDIVQVVVLAAPGPEDDWSVRHSELTENITRLIADRRAPVGLWVFG